MAERCRVCNGRGEVCGPRCGHCGGTGEVSPFRGYALPEGRTMRDVLDDQEALLDSEPPRGTDAKGHHPR